MGFAAELIALSVGLIWAISGLISVGPVRAFGGPAFNRVRMNTVVVMLSLALLISGTFELLPWSSVAILGISGFIGIFLGDTLLFSALGRLGPRRNAMLFATNAPMAALLAVAVGKDVISPLEWLGIFLVLAGVLIAIVYGKRKEERHIWNEVRGSLAIGVMIALAAAACQAMGLVISDFVLDVPEGEKPPVILVALIRVGIAAVALNALAFAGMQAMQPLPGVTRKHWYLAIASGLWGMGLGMTLLVWAQTLGSEVGLISALSQTTPVWILPLIWFWTGQRPAALAFVGALVATAGVFLIALT